MQRTVTVETFPLRTPFRIARGAKTHAHCVAVRIERDGAVGHGECVPYPRYDETVDGVTSAIEALRPGIGRDELQNALPPGAARNAVDAALWDWEAKASGRRVHLAVCTSPPRPLVTAYTISLGAVGDMAEVARAASGHRVLKVKLGAGDGHDGARIHAVASAAPDSRLILDANEGWSADELPELMLDAARVGVALIEQPLPAGDDAILADLPHPVPIAADESVHVAADLAGLRDRYDYVNIKLDKSGGLTEALRMRGESRRLGFGVMVGCMVGSSLAMAPAVLLAQEADVVDLDAPLLLARDREPALSYTGSIVSPPSPTLWG